MKSCYTGDTKVHRVMKAFDKLCSEDREFFRNAHINWSLKHGVDIEWSKKRDGEASQRSLKKVLKIDRRLLLHASANGLRRKHD